MQAVAPLKTQGGDFATGWETSMSNVQAGNQEAQGHGPEKPFTVVVNGREKVVTAKELSFADIVALSGLPGGPNTVFTVTYRRGEGKKPEGTLVDGDTVKVKDGMIFNVTATNKS
jgi:hypothetical protein